MKKDMLNESILDRICQDYEAFVDYCHQGGCSTDDTEAFKQFIEDRYAPYAAENIDEYFFFGSDGDTKTPQEIHKTRDRYYKNKKDYNKYLEKNHLPDTMKNYDDYPGEKPTEEEYLDENLNESKVFDIRNFLIENKLTPTSKVKKK